MLKNPLVLIMILALAAILVYVLFFFPGSPGALPPAQQPPPTLCTEGQTQYCAIDSCSGTRTCVGGVWSGCRWQQVCTPGSRIPCLRQDCSYAVQTCNECGSGYGPCLNASSATNSS